MLLYILAELVPCNPAVIIMFLYFRTNEIRAGLQNISKSQKKPIEVFLIALPIWQTSVYDD